jgi:hypothetical protein
VIWQTNKKDLVSVIWQTNKKDLVSMIWPVECICCLSGHWVVKQDVKKCMVFSKNASCTITAFLKTINNKTKLLNSIHCIQSYFWPIKVSFNIFIVLLLFYIHGYSWYNVVLVTGYSWNTEQY